MKDWKQFYADKLVTEEYYITIPTQYDIFTFNVRYVRRNGYTLILPVVMDITQVSDFGKLFIDWFKIRSDFNTRYDAPHWWKKIRFNRKQKIVSWAVSSIDTAYSEFKKEMIDKTINQ